MKFIKYGDLRINLSNITFIKLWTSRRERDSVEHLYYIVDFEGPDCKAQVSFESERDRDRFLNVIDDLAIVNDLSSETKS